MQKGLDFLLKKYAVKAEATLTDDKAVVVEGQSVPLLPWKNERRFTELHNLVVQKRVGNLCTCRIGCTTQKTADIFMVLKREIGILEYTVNSDVKEIFCVKGKNVLNCIAETHNGCVCTLELSCTLSEQDETVDKHEIITDNGLACDRVVDTQIPQQSIYIFGKETAAYTDVDSELFGYTVPQIAAIRNAFSVCKDKAKRADQIAADEHLEAVVKAAKTSLQTMENVKVGEV